MRLANFIDDRACAQRKFNRGRNLNRNELIIEALGHLIEETMEARACVPRRYWKAEEFDREEFLREMADVQIWLANTAGLAGITGKEMEEAIETKLQYNLIRQDHLHNS